MDLYKACRGVARAFGAEVTRRIMVGHARALGGLLTRVPPASAQRVRQLINQDFRRAPSIDGRRADRTDGAGRGLRRSARKRTDLGSRRARRRRHLSRLPGANSSRALWPALPIPCGFSARSAGCRSAADLPVRTSAEAQPPQRGCACLPEGDGLAPSRIPAAALKLGEAVMSACRRLETVIGLPQVRARNASTKSKIFLRFC